LVTKEGRFVSDFAWACTLDANNAPSQAAPTGHDMPAQGNALGNGVNNGPSPEGAKQPDPWPTIRAQALALLGGDVRNGDSCGAARDPRIKDFAGSISFLPAYPVDLGKTGQMVGLPVSVPELAKLELDVVTVHHKQYYNEPAEPKDVPHSHSKWQNWKRDHDEWQAKWSTAPDIEDPVPNVFPAVAAGLVFAFAVLPLRNSPTNLLTTARIWLATGLSTFGLGAKTNAGYGWFEDVSEVVQPILALLNRITAVDNEAAKFSGWSEEQCIEFVLKLADMPEVCRSWRERHAQTAAPVLAFAESQGLPLP
jgi:hypothetical protein